MERNFNFAKSTPPRSPSGATCSSDGQSCKKQSRSLLLKMFSLMKENERLNSEISDLKRKMDDMETEHFEELEKMAEENAIVTELNSEIFYLQRKLEKMETEHFEELEKMVEENANLTEMCEHYREQIVELEEEEPEYMYGVGRMYDAQLEEVLIEKTTEPMSTEVTKNLTSTIEESLKERLNDLRLQQESRHAQWKEEEPEYMYGVGRMYDAQLDEVQEVVMEKTPEPMSVEVTKNFTITIEERLKERLNDLRLQQESRHAQWQEVQGKLEEECQQAKNEIIKLQEETTCLKRSLAEKDNELVLMRKEKNQSDTQHKIDLTALNSILSTQKLQLEDSSKKVESCSKEIESLKKKIEDSRTKRHSEGEEHRMLLEKFVSLEEQNNQQLEKDKAHACQIHELEVELQDLSRRSMQFVRSSDDCSSL